MPEDIQPTQEEIEAAAAEAEQAKEEYLADFHAAAQEQLEELEATREGLHNEVDQIIEAAKEALKSE